MLKLHCNKCHRFIKEVKPGQVAHLKGDEVCESCVKQARSTLSRLEEAYNVQINKLGGIYNNAVKELEEIIHRELDV